MCLWDFDNTSSCCLNRNGKLNESDLAKLKPAALSEKAV